MSSPQGCLDHDCHIRGRQWGTKDKTSNSATRLSSPSVVSSLLDAWLERHTQAGRPTQRPPTLL